MKIKEISFVRPNLLEEIADIEDYNVDVFVELEDGYTCTVVVGTAKNLEWLIEKEKKNFFGPSHPFIIVKKLTKEIIEETIQAYAENNGYWLKLYHFASKIDMSVFDKLQAEHEEHLKELDELDKLENF